MAPQWPSIAKKIEAEAKKSAARRGEFMPFLHWDFYPGLRKGGQNFARTEARRGERGLTACTVTAQEKKGGGERCKGAP